MKPHLSIYKMYSEQVLLLGFSRLSTAWWQRKKGLILQKIYIHKFSVTTNFRVHAAIHLVGFDQDAHWLNGIYSHDGGFDRHVPEFPFRRYNFNFAESQNTWQSSADNLLEFTKDILIPWFDKWSDINLLQKDPNSPLNDEQKRFLASTTERAPAPWKSTEDGQPCQGAPLTRDLRLARDLRQANALDLRIPLGADERTRDQ